MKKEIKRDIVLLIAGEGGGAELHRVHFEDGTSLFMDDLSRFNGVANDFFDEEDDDIRYDYVDVYFNTFDEYWQDMFPRNNGWWNLGFFSKSEDVYVLVKEKFLSELSKLNFSSQDIELITNNRVKRDFGKYKLTF